MRSRQYYDSLSTQQLLDAARFEAREGRPQPELLTVLADVLDAYLDEVEILECRIGILEVDLEAARAKSQDI